MKYGDECQEQPGRKDALAQRVGTERGASEPSLGARLSHAPLSHAPLSHAPLSHAPLSHARLSHVPLSHTPLSQPHGFTSLEAPRAARFGDGMGFSLTEARLLLSSVFSFSSFRGSHAGWILPAASPHPGVACVASLEQKTYDPGNYKVSEALYQEPGAKADR